MNVFASDRQQLSFFHELVEAAVASGTARKEAGSQIVQVPLEGASIRVGNIFSLLSTTIQGELASPVWLTLEAAAYLAAQDFNNRRSVLSNDLSDLTEGCNFYMTIDYRDAQFSPIVTGAHFQNGLLLPASGADAMPVIPFAVLGPVRSSSSAIVATLGGVFGDRSAYDNDGREQSLNNTDSRLEKQGMINISPASTSSDLEDKAAFPYFAGTIPSNKGDAEALCLYLNSIGVGRLGVFYVDDTYGRNFLGQLRDSSACRGIRMTSKGFAESLGDSLTIAMEHLQYQNERYLFGIFSASHWQEVVLALYDEGLLGTQDRFWFFADALLAAVGMEIDADGDGGLELSNALNRSAVVALHRLEQSRATTESLLDKFAKDQSAVRGFVSRHRGDVISEMNYSDFVDFFSPSPSIFTMMAYDAVLALGIAACQTPTAHFTGPELYDALVQVKYDGATGPVSFDPNTGTRDYGAVEFEISNLLVRSNASKFVVQDTKSIVIRGDASVDVIDPLIFSDGTTTPTLWQPPSKAEDLNLIPLGVRSICFSLSSLVILFSLYCGFWTIRNRQRPSVRISQPIFLCLLCLGTFLTGWSLVLGNLQEPIPKQTLDVTCMAEVWLLSTGFGTSFAALFAKTWRINQVYQSSTQFRRVVIRPIDVLWPMAVLTTANLTILVTWTIMDPLVWQRIPLRIDQYGSVLESRGTCFDPATGPRQTIFTFCLLSIAVGTLFLSNWQSFKARRLPLEFNETTYIGIANVVMLEALLIGVPVVVVVGDDPVALTLVETMVISLTCLGILIPLFFPKMTIKNDTHNRRRVPNSTTQYRPDDSGLNSRQTDDSHFSDSGFKARRSDDSHFADSDFKARRSDVSHFSDSDFKARRSSRRSTKNGPQQPPQIQLRAF